MIKLIAYIYIYICLWKTELYKNVKYILTSIAVQNSGRNIIECNFINMTLKSTI